MLVVGICQVLMQQNVLSGALAELQAVLREQFIEPSCLDLDASDESSVHRPKVHDVRPDFALPRLHSLSELQY